MPDGLKSILEIIESATCDTMFKVLLEIIETDKDLPVVELPAKLISLFNDANLRQRRLMLSITKSLPLSTTWIRSLPSKQAL